MAVSASRDPATRTVYDFPAARVSGTDASTVAVPEDRTSPVAGPGSSSAGAEAAVLPTACATVFPLTTRSSAPASGDALASRSRAISLLRGPITSGPQPTTSTAASAARITVRMKGILLPQNVSVPAQRRHTSLYARDRAGARRVTSRDGRRPAPSARPLPTPTTM